MSKLVFVFERFMWNLRGKDEGSALFQVKLDGAEPFALLGYETIHFPRAPDCRAARCQNADASWTTHSNSAYAGCLDRPAFLTALPGIRSMEDFEQILEYEKTTENPGLFSFWKGNGWRILRLLLFSAWLSSLLAPGDSYSFPESRAALNWVSGMILLRIVLSCSVPSRPISSCTLFSDSGLKFGCSVRFPAKSFPSGVFVFNKSLAISLCPLTPN